MNPNYLKNILNSSNAIPFNIRPNSDIVNDEGKLAQLINNKSNKVENIPVKEKERTISRHNTFAVKGNKNEKLCFSKIKQNNPSSIHNANSSLLTVTKTTSNNVSLLSNYNTNNSKRNTTSCTSKIPQVVSSRIISKSKSTISKIN